jgi:hypothetical protein
MIFIIWVPWTGVKSLQKCVFSIYEYEFQGAVIRNRQWRFRARNFGHGYNAHNAILLLLIENGILGFGIYIILVGGMIVLCIINKNYSPSLAAVCFILIYGLGQNREWTSITTLLFVISMAAELRMSRLKKFIADKQVASNSVTTLMKKVTSL